MQYVVVLLVLIVVAAIVWQPSSVTVYQFERGLRYRRGRFVGLIEPGVHWITKRSGRIIKVDMRPAILPVPGQELLSSDGIGLKVSLVANIEIADPDLALNKQQDYRTSVYTTLQLALREVVGAITIEELLSSRAKLGPQLKERCITPIAEAGVKLISVDIRDVMLPGDLKRIFAQEVEARKEGLAALERARGETAALRSLANAARLIQDNPALLQLRLLQSIGGSTGNTVVLGNADYLPTRKAGGPTGTSPPSAPPEAGAE